MNVVGEKVTFRISQTLQDLNPTVFANTGPITAQQAAIVNFGTKSVGIGFQINLQGANNPLDVSFSPFRIYENLTQSFRVPSTASIPNLEVLARASPDGKQICELEFSITYYNQCTVKSDSGYSNGIIAVTDAQCERNLRYARRVAFCNTVEKSLTLSDFYSKSDYKQYCVNFPSVLKGTGCTLEEKVLSMLPEAQSEIALREDCLQSNSEAQVAAFLQYMLIRYILSGVIWGQFSVQWLRQKYTRRFEQTIKDGQFEVFLPYLNPVFARYFIR